MFCRETCSARIVEKSICDITVQCQGGQRERRGEKSFSTQFSHWIKIFPARNVDFDFLFKCFFFFKCCKSTTSKTVFKLDLY